MFTASENWTDDRVAVLKEMWGKGDSAAVIAKVLGSGFTRASVTGKVHRLKLAPRPTITAAKVKPTDRRSHKHGGLAFAIARARKEAAGGTPAASVSEAILGLGSLGAPRIVEPVKTIIDPGPVISLMELTDKTCRWPIGDPKEAGFGFCGKPPIEGKRYCPMHHARSVGKVRADAG